MTVGNVAAENAFELAFVYFKQLGKLNRFSGKGNPSVVSNCSDGQGVRNVACDFKQEAGIAVIEYALTAHISVKLKSERVSETHFHNSLCNAAHSRSIAGNSPAGAYKRGDFVKGL